MESGIEKTGSRHICQEVCPWNSFATESTEEAFLAREGLDGPPLIEEPLVRGQAAWVGTEAARQALRGREEVGGGRGGDLRDQLSLDED